MLSRKAAASPRNHGLPLARTEALLVEPIGDEVVIYDVERKEAHCLKALGALVFGNSDGRTSTVQLAELATLRLGEPVDTARVEEVLAQLDERSLIADLPIGGGISRRDMMRRSAMAGAAAVAAPVISTILAPSAAAATSLGPCETRRCSQCCAGGGQCECECGANANDTDFCQKRPCSPANSTVGTGTCASGFCDAAGFCTPS